MSVGFTATGTGCIGAEGEALLASRYRGTAVGRPIRCFFIL